MLVECVCYVEYVLECLGARMVFFSFSTYQGIRRTLYDTIGFVYKYDVHIARRADRTRPITSNLYSLPDADMQTFNCRIPPPIHAGIV